MQKDRKREHKKIVKYTRRINKQISSDEYLGLNRFRIDIYSEDMYRYSDGSGVHLYLIFKLTDNVTNNSAYFTADNYNYDWYILQYTNDFLIRCSTGRYGHQPLLHYIAYDVHEVVEYDGRKDCKPKFSDEAIDIYNFTKLKLF